MTSGRGNKTRCTKVKRLLKRAVAREPQDNTSCTLSPCSMASHSERKRCFASSMAPLTAYGDASLCARVSICFTTVPKAASSPLWVSAALMICLTSVTRSRRWPPSVHVLMSSTENHDHGSRARKSRERRTRGSRQMCSGHRQRFGSRGAYRCRAALSICATFASIARHQLAVSRAQMAARASKIQPSRHSANTLSAGSVIPKATVASKPTALTIIDP